MKKDAIWRKERFIVKQDKAKEKKEVKSLEKEKRKAYAK
jgi:hypothetical protein